MRRGLIHHLFTKKVICNCARSDKEPHSINYIKQEHFQIIPTHINWK